MPWGSCVENGVATLACIPVIINNIINAALVLAGITALILMIISGAKYISSQGDPQKLESARKTFFYAVLGLFIVLLSFTIVNVISQATGVKQITSPTL